MIPNLLFALLLIIAGWVAFGWWLDDRAEAREDLYDPLAPRGRHSSDRDTVRLPIHLIGERA